METLCQCVSVKAAVLLEVFPGTSRKVDAKQIMELLLVDKGRTNQERHQVKDGLQLYDNKLSSAFVW